MDELGWFSCPSSFGATPRPAPAYPCTYSLIFGAYGSHCAALKKEDTFWGHHMAGRLPWSANHGAATLYKRWCTGVVMGTLLFLVALVPHQVLLPSTLFALASLQVHKKKKKNISFLCILICIPCLPYSLCKNVFVVVLLPCKNGFVVRHHPQEWFCGVLSPTRTILWVATNPLKDY